MSIEVIEYTDLNDMPDDVEPSNFSDSMLTYTLEETSPGVTEVVFRIANTVITPEQATALAAIQQCGAVADIRERLEYVHDLLLLQAPELGSDN